VAIMASAIAHDMRQPLAFIEPTLASLKLDVENLQRRRHTEAQLRERMEDMADQLADLGKGIDRFKLMINTLFNSLKNQPVKTEPLDLRKVVESAVLITRGTIIRRAGFKLDLPPEPVMMMASEGRLVQLVVNLLLNATQAITQGNQMTNTIGLVVSVGETTVAISVSDTGCGITPQNLEQIFAPFFTTKGESGSGLGLPICKQIVEEMQGKMEVQSEVGQGTTFRVTLPRGEAEAQG